MGRVVARQLVAGEDALGLAFARLGLPTPAREYLAERLVPCALLLTGLSPTEARFLKAVGQEASEPLPTFVAGDGRHREGVGLLVGRREEVSRLLRRAALDPALAALCQAAEAALAPPPQALRLGNRTLPLGQRTYVMGVVNVTPDSFSDGGRFAEPAAAIEHALLLVEAGADLLDLGGESTRPGADPVGLDEELRRVMPVLEGLKGRTDVPLSIDTTKAAVAEAALGAGACLVNDVSGLTFDPELASVVARFGAGLCVMHLKGTPRTMQADLAYDDVLDAVLAHLSKAIERAAAAGVARAGILVDAGIGFGKSPAQNLFLLRRMQELRALGQPILVGTSRKSFLGHLAGAQTPGERLIPSVASVAAVAALGGVDVVRVHDVRETRQALAVVDALRTAQDGGMLYEPVVRRG